MPAKLKLEGLKFGKLTVVQLHHSDKIRGTVWTCKCECGNIVNYHGSVLRNGEAKTCGSSKCRSIDLSGKKFGRWTAISYDTEGSSKKFIAYWNCICECGNKKSIRGTALTSGNSLSCMCRRIEMAKKINTLPYGKAALNGVFSRYKREAKKRGFVWELNKEEFIKITSLNCHYCGIEPSNINRNVNDEERGNFVYNGIDRIDNAKGYTSLNIVPCCKVCNRIKYKSSYEDFLKYIDRIYNFQHRRDKNEPTNQN